ncbi:hypothetical protein ACXU4B_13645 [Dyella soli]|uniref:GIY-YIG domain-containing protein n=1 Tax=Dyella soli TaxID=522319 RepID=A0A4R0YKL7_9GAMM|nr:hypothetical protein [Dyella soli]TCI06825.1 hypothetical protein EZM97_29790 [Dyella soli]
MTIQSLEKKTGEFFLRHWANTGLSIPEWQCWDDFLHAPVPSYNLGGCYALFQGSSLIYVGSGISRGSGRYRDQGISTRMMKHVYSTDRDKPGMYKLCDKWAAVTAIFTIGFPNECAYLAVALETYLIRELGPPRNRRL